MNTAPRINIRPNGRYLNIDAEDTEIGYLTITKEGRINGSWAYEYDNRWLIDVVRECYIAAQRAYARGCAFSVSHSAAAKESPPTPTTN